MGTISLIVLLAAEAFFFLWALKTRSSHAQEKSIVRIAAFALLIVLLLTGIFEWGFRYYLVLTALAVQAAIGTAVLIRKTEKPYKLSRNVRRVIGCVFLYVFALVPSIVFPQYEQPTITGSYEVATAKYTWVDEGRIETFSNAGDNRTLTVEFWYPQDIDGKVPLVVFSHGAFGYSGSNQSTFVELASNGYVVASIGHTYHAFFTVDTSGKLTTVNTYFFSDINRLNTMGDNNQIFIKTSEWMRLRVDDQHFVIDSILTEAESEVPAQPFSLINTQKIGVFGHSLGGASLSQLARERVDISAAIVLDGTMMGEQIGVENGEYTLNDIPYPVPLLNIYAQDHYEAGMAELGENYVNFFASRNAITAYEVIFRDAGHLNFTDLPLFSPLLAKMLGVGTVDARYCIEKTNSLVLEFFNYYLKGGEAPIFEREY